MGPHGILDTNILIDYLRGRAEAHAVVNSGSEFAISVITWIEVMAGTRTGDEKWTEAFLRAFHVVPLKPAIMHEAAQLRRSTRLKLPDAIILATAHVEDSVLLTRNTRDFTPGRFVRIPYTI